MFQNIEKGYEKQNAYIEEEENPKRKTIIKNLFTKQNLILYVITFLISMVKIQESESMFFAPFGLAILAASLSNQTPIGIIYIITLISTTLKFGNNQALSYFLTTCIFFVSILLIKPKEQENVNEKRKVGMHLLISSFIVQIIPMFFRSFYLYDLLTSIMLSITTYVFYKIFANSLIAIREFGKKKAFSIEEVMGTTLLLAITASILDPIYIFGYSVKNIISILLVLILGWKNGILVGATGGITIGVVLGIIGSEEPIMVAAYALSGMIAGIFNKLGKLGVIAGFLLGNVILTYVANGNTVPILVFQEVLIASLGLLAVPKTLQIPIEELYIKDKLLPDTTGRTLEENKETVYKLNSMSETISEIAKTYQEAAATIIEDDEITNQENKNREIFVEELQNNLEGLEQNLLYEVVQNAPKEMMENIFSELLKENVLTRTSLLNILSSYNQYIVGFETEKINNHIEEEISAMLRAINYAYRMSKVKFVWEKKMQENKKTVSNQLEGVSKAISDLAEEISPIQEDKFLLQKEKIKVMLQQKEIPISEIKIKEETTGRKIVEVYTKVCETIDGTQCYIKKIGKIIEKVLEEPMAIQKQQCGLRLRQENCIYTYISEDRYHMQVGIAKSTKAGSPISGDTSIQTKLGDGKYLLAISDGMGSGPEARKSSKIAIKMLERLLTAGFNKDVSLQLINSTISSNTQEDMYATLDIQILDLYSGNMEFIKNGACPTYVKNKKEVQLLKSITLPTGILPDVDLVVFDKDIKAGDIIVMCSDGILEANTEYTNKELWLKFLLEEIQTDDVQKIADIILAEAIDHNYGIEKDDMTVIVAKINNK